MRTPRPYQTDCLDAISAAFRRGIKGVVVELATGLGKGYIIAAAARMVRERGKRVLIAVNRDNLCEQLMQSCVEQGLLPMLEKAENKASRMSDLVVGSIQTMQGERLRRWSPDHFDLVICDEVHFGASDTFKSLLDYFIAGYHLGLSATIERHDKQGLWKGYRECVYSFTLNAAIEEGWLVPFEFQELAVPITISDEQAKKKRWTQEDEEGVFSAGDYLPKLFHEASLRVREGKSLFFWPNCDSSIEANKHFQSVGIESMHIEGEGGPAGLNYREIQERLAWFKQPGAKCLHNADLLSYGYDNPQIDTVGIMRLSRSIPMLKQRLGRGTRAACVIDGLADAEARRNAIAGSVKPKCLVLDLMLQLGSVKNKFADATSLITEDDEERKWIREESKKEGRPLTMKEIEGKLRAKRETDKEKQLAKLAEDAANAASKGAHVVNPRGIFIGDILQNFNPNHKPASPAFERYIRKLGINIGKGPFSAMQLMNIKLRYESKAKQLA